MASPGWWVLSGDRSGVATPRRVDQGDEDGHFDEGSGHAGQGFGGGDGDGAPSSGVLMPSTPSAYPQVVSRRLASFRVVKSGISAVHAVL
jgi:hypothetical protein